MKTQFTQILEPHLSSEDNSMPLFRLAFRPFFLFGAIFSIVSLVLWFAMLNGNYTQPLYGDSFWWHTHEMLFGFVAAIVVGFVLTAVQTWTGVPSIKGKTLAFLFTLWLIARVSFFFPEYLPAYLIASIDLLFLPLSAYALAKPIIKIKQWRNMMFIPILLVMALINFMMHSKVLLNDKILKISNSNLLQTNYLDISHSMVLLVTLLICILGGRVIPMFTANGTKTPKVNPLPWLEVLSIFSVFLLVLFSLMPQLIAVEYISVQYNATLFFIASAIHFIRVLRWRIWVTLKTPLVWSLHFSYWCIPLGFLAFGLSLLGIAFSFTQATHTLTIGAISGMILAMISRVSLGHTGRMIFVNKLMAFSLLAIFLAFMVRVFSSFWFANYLLILGLSIILWIMAFGGFIWQYFSILTSPRVDGKNG